MGHSLSGRLLLTASAVLFTFLGLTGLVLDQAFRSSAEENLSELLLLQIYGLLAVAEESGDGIYLPDELQEPRLNQLGGGLFGFVHDGDLTELWHSPSAVALQIPAVEWRRVLTGLDTGARRFRTIEDVERNEFFCLSYAILWEGDGAGGTPFIVTAVATKDPFRAEIRGFRANLWGWLGGAALALLSVQALIMRWGLAPLRQVADDLKAIEDGRAESLTGDYPDEIAGVTHNLNLLIASERQQREQYRTTLADLAHSLKTPLAVLRGSAGMLQELDGELRETRDVSNGARNRMAEIMGTVEEQVDRMDEIVSYQLQRAVSRSAQLLQRPVQLEQVTGKLIAAMDKVYRERDIRFETELNDCIFLGDERDLMEVLGNLVDNSCKYGAHTVRILASPVSGEEGGRRGLEIVVEDDGEGIAAEIRREVLQRGIRADSRAPGQGIGLAVVAEIVDRYQGSIEFGDSRLGGASVTVRLR